MGVDSRFFIVFAFAITFRTLAIPHSVRMSSVLMRESLPAHEKCFAILLSAGAVLTKIELTTDPQEIRNAAENGGFRCRHAYSHRSTTLPLRRPGCRTRNSSAPSPPARRPERSDGSGLDPECDDSVGAIVLPIFWPNPGSA